MPRVGPASSYVDAVRKRCAPEVQDWWDQACATALDDSGPHRFAGAFAAASRRLGVDRVDLDAEERATFDSGGLGAAQGWTLGALGRVVLLCVRSQGVQGGDAPAWAHDLFAKGDNLEREAVLRALSALPNPDSFLSTAVEACRSHVQVVFEAIACENPYPAAHFPDLHFEQLVLKALFVEVPISRIQGLKARITPQLVRMAQDYASERRAAGRSVPADIEAIVGDS